MAGMLLLAAVLSTVAQSETANPVGKVVQLLSDLQAKVTDEGRQAQKLMTEFEEFCEERNADLGYELKTAKGEKADLEAVIAEEAARVEALDEKIADLAGSIAKAEKDLQAATNVRGKEMDDFEAGQKELMETIDTLQRAIRILEKHASLLQAKNAGNIAQALDALVQASALSSADATQLSSLVQNSQDSSDVGAPDAAVYEGHSGDIVETLQGLLDKAEDQLAELRKAEVKNRHAYELVKQSLDDEIKYGDKDLAKSKVGRAQSNEKKANAEADLKETDGLISTNTAALAELQQDCEDKAVAYEAEAKSRAEELKALAEAKKVIEEKTGDAEKISYDFHQASFLQLKADADNKYQIVRFVRELAKSQPALAQLSMRVASVMRARMSTGEDPFGKVKGLISDMISKLEEEAEADATHKAYCDKELKETKVKQADKNAEIQKLSTKIDSMAARSAQLKAEIAATQKALAELAAAQAEMNIFRQEENEAYKKARPELEQGIEGVKAALKVLRDYYSSDDKAHDAATGAGQGIIGLLEVIESDFSTGLAQMIATEEAAAAEYDRQSKENEVEQAAKEQDVKFKTQEATDLDKAAAEATSDREGVANELDAVMDYLKNLEKQCIEKAETFEERKRRFEAELAGLKQALQILEGEAEASLLQTSSRSSWFNAASRSLRAVRRH